MACGATVKFSITFLEVFNDMNDKMIKSLINKLDFSFKSDLDGKPSAKNN